MENRWADPAGNEGEPPRVRYRIRDASGAIVDRVTSTAYDSKRQRYYHSLAPFDQPFADEIVELVQRASAYFYAAEDDYQPLEGVADVRVTDDEVRTRIARLEQGENVREAERTGLEYYPLSDLPFDQQRALIEQIEALKRRWGFEILGEVEEEPARRAS